MNLTSAFMCTFLGFASCPETYAASFSPGLNELVRCAGSKSTVVKKPVTTAAPVRLTLPSNSMASDRPTTQVRPVLSAEAEKEYQADRRLLLGGLKEVLKATITLKKDVAVVKAASASRRAPTLVDFIGGRMGALETICTKYSKGSQKNLSEIYYAAVKNLMSAPHIRTLLGSKKMRDQFLSSGGSTGFLHCKAGKSPFTVYDKLEGDGLIRSQYLQRVIKVSAADIAAWIKDLDKTLAEQDKAVATLLRFANTKTKFSGESASLMKIYLADSVTDYPLAYAKYLKATKGFGDGDRLCAAIQRDENIKSQREDVTTLIMVAGIAAVPISAALPAAGAVAFGLGLASGELIDQWSNISKLSERIQTLERSANLKLMETELADKKVADNVRERNWQILSLIAAAGGGVIAPLAKAVGMTVKAGQATNLVSNFDKIENIPINSRLFIDAAGDPTKEAAILGLINVYGSQKKVVSKKLLAALNTAHIADAKNTAGTILRTEDGKASRILAAQAIIEDELAPGLTAQLQKKGMSAKEAADQGKTLARTEARKQIRILQKANVIGLTPEQGKRYATVEKTYKTYINSVATNSKPVGRLNPGALVKVDGKIGKVFIKNGKPQVSFDDLSEIDISGRGTVDVLATDSSTQAKMNSIADAIAHKQTRDGVPLDTPFYKTTANGYWGKEDILNFEREPGVFETYYLVGRDPIDPLKVIAVHKRQIDALGLQRALANPENFQSLSTAGGKTRLVSHGDFFTKYFERAMLDMKNNPLVALVQQAFH